MPPLRRLPTVLRALAAFFVLASAALLARAETLDFSADWRFHRGDLAGAQAPGLDDAAWDLVTLPHTPRIEALVTDLGAHRQWEGICWYRKSLTLPADAIGKIVTLRFDGAMNAATLYVNGREVASHLDGYLPFDIDLSRFAEKPGALELAVRLDNRHSDITGPKPLDQLDFQTYGGLYRRAWLRIEPRLYITDPNLEDTPAEGGVFVTYPTVTQAYAMVAIQVDVRNRTGAPAGFGLRAVLTDPNGKRVASRNSNNLQLADGHHGTFKIDLGVGQPRLWSPLSPALYHLQVELLSDGTTTDRRSLDIGIRRLSLEPHAMSFDDHPLFLQGVNRHQEYPYIGNAVPPAAQARDAWLIKAAGFDFVRLSHYPQSPAFMDACDRLGLAVMPAILGWQYNPATPAFEANRIAAVHALVRRDRNHPSAVMWETSLNETPMTPEFIARLDAAAHEEYPGEQMITAGWIKGFDVKLTARQHGSTKEFEHATFPCFVSEYGDWEYYAMNAGFSQDKWSGLKQADRSSRQARGDGEVRLLQQATNIQEAHNENLGTMAFGDAYWVMFDYNRGYAPDLETSGVMDIFRLPKFSYYFFQSQRDPDQKFPDGIGGPMVRIASWWTPASPLDVRVFSNCDEVELFLNGHSLGRHKPDRDRISTNLRHPPFTFHIPRFEPGELRAVAYLHGREVAQQAVYTPGAPFRLEVWYEKAGYPLESGGDVVIIHAQAVDANGTVVPEFHDPVTFKVEGDATLIGENPIPAEAGIASILLKSGDTAKPLRLRATAGGLGGILEVKPLAPKAE
ncbi:beta-galactosidase [mine drainage metagenome]|uniref:Beta-galactosidase n=1 Tax=mine drainage metagenome TaxID=410659 RepID=A0A1J5RS43_9ZZZZ